MKVFVLSNQARSMSIFWRVLIRQMGDMGMAVSCCTPPGDERAEAALKSMGASVIHYNLDRKGLNPFRDLRTYLELKKIFRDEKPDLLFATTIKPVIYGSAAAHSAGVSAIFATITGLGYAFEADNFFKKCVNRVSRLLYRHSLAYATGIFFQNMDDVSLFRKSGIFSRGANILIARGTGVDTSYFASEPFPDMASGIVFLMISRLLEAKGIAEYAKAAAILKVKYPAARFLLLGAPETGLGSISVEKLKEYEPALEYLGESRDVRPFIANSHVAVLPSWREGTPTSIMEAMSMGRPCVVTDVPGCREVVINGRNGWIVPRSDPLALAAGMEKFLLAPETIPILGEQSRQIALEDFDAQKVAAKILADMRRLSPNKEIWPEAKR